MSEEKHYPIRKLCYALQVNRSAYYKWTKRESSVSEQQNKEILQIIYDLYSELDGILGYRQMTIVINKEYQKKYNPKRIYRLMSLAGLKSVTRIKRRRYVYYKPDITAENILNREFYADKTNEKWLTDVTELKYGGHVLKEFFMIY